MNKRASPEKVAREFLKRSMSSNPEYRRLQEYVRGNPRDKEAVKRLWILRNRLGISPGYKISLLKEIVTEEARETGHINEEDREWIEEDEKYKTLKDLVRYSLGGNLKNSWIEMTKSWDGSLTLKTQADEDYSSGDDTYYSAFLKRLDGSPFPPYEIEYLKRKLGIRFVH